MKRLNLELSNDIYARIEEIRDQTDASSMTEVVRRALATYDKLVEIHYKRGGKIVLMEDGFEKELLIIP